MASSFSWAAPALSDEDQRLVEAYRKAGKPLDWLAYSKEFEELARDVLGNPMEEDKAQLFRRLLNLRKRARLPRTVSADVPAHRGLVSPEDQDLISAYLQVGKTIDALPYTDDFDRLIDLLGKPTTQAIKHSVFQHLLSLRKRGYLPSATSGI